MSRTPVLTMIGVVLVGLALAGRAGESSGPPRQEHPGVPEIEPTQGGELPGKTPHDTIEIAVTREDSHSVTGALVSVGPSEQRYGYGVTVQPDAEWADFIECGLTVFRLDSGERLQDLPTLRIMAGTHNGMLFHDGELEVELSCGVNRQMTEVVYEVKGTVGDRTVLYHQATVRPKA